MQMQLTPKKHIFLWLMVALLVSACASQQQVQKDKEGVRARAQAHTNLGAAYYQQGKLDIALEEFNLAVESDPTYAFAFNGLGLVNAALKQDKEANEYFNRAIALEPNNSEAHNNLGNFLCSRGRYDESIKEYLTAVKNPLYATPALAYTNAGVCSARKKDLNSAELYYKKALEVDPLNQQAAYQLATLQFQRKEAEAAYKTLQNVLVTKASPEILLLAINITRSLNMKQAEREARMQLFQLYPNSEQVKKLQAE